MSATDPAIVTEGLVKRYGEGENAFLALRGIDLVVPRGEVLFVTGPSGSGKTTLLSILGCVLSPTEGRATVLGVDVGRAKEGRLAAFRRASIGFVFQGHNLLASQDAVGNVRLPLMLNGVMPGEATRRAVAELEAVGLGAKLDRLPRDLSGGQRQRVAIARATAGRPPLVLADEPTASLDARSGREVMELLTRLARERGTTVLVVTHDSRIFPYADRVVAIEDGRLVQETAA
jgi:putative ABC transport system ATP-binding protein